VAEPAATGCGWKLLVPTAGGGLLLCDKVGCGFDSEADGGIVVT